MKAINNVFIREFEKTYGMLKKIFWVAMLLCFLTVPGVQPVRAEEPAETSEKSEVGPSTKNSKISLAEVAPELYYQLRRYPKFYGDANTAQGGLLERSQLLGSFGGVRDDLVDHGFYFDAAVTQFLQGNVSGGIDDGEARYNGSADYWLTFDSGKAGLWSGGAVFLHAESSWRADKSVNSDTGSLLPANFDATMPTPNDSETLALPELYLVQALPANTLVLAGKVDWAGLADNNLFANNERTQFIHTGLVNNPILGAFVPYTSLGLGGVWVPSKKHAVALIGVVPVAEESDNYAFLLNFDQYLWVKGKSADAYQERLDASLNPGVGRQHLAPVGIGIFGRAGWAPKDRNVIDQFYSFGIGGYGILIPGRENDQWGVGWTGTHISNDLRDDVGLLGIDLDSFEHAVEAFYNFQVTPATHLTVNAQLIDSPADSVDTSLHARHASADRFLGFEHIAAILFGNSLFQPKITLSLS